ncbi:hypothetical protein F5883DRAFT_537942 [Diaporthe sp. PMI_573]|nr:hypothetical protein F5883DRAFT_537942 [Diaporthaceae sp. PMI_573]
MAGIALDISRVRDSERGQVKEFVAHLNDLRAGVQGKDAAICQSLLEAFEQDLLSLDVFSIFITWSKSPAVIARCLNYGSNTVIRRLAIKELGKHLRHPGKFDWELTWKALGGTEGLVRIFGRSSVAEVKNMSVFIGGSNFGKEDKIRERCVEELLRVLLPGVYSTRGVQSKDKRPIQHHYVRMLSACSPSFVNEVLNSRDESNPLFRWRDLTRLVRSHKALLRERAINHLFGSGPYDEDVPGYLQHFLRGDRDFAIKSLKGRLDGSVSDQRWGYNEELEVLMPIVNRLVKDWRAPIEQKNQIHDLIKLGLEILGKYRDQTKVGSRDLWAVTFSRWQTWPDKYEDLLRLGLNSGLAKLPHKDPGSYLSVLRRLQPGPRQRLLQLCYLDIPERGLELFSAEDYSTIAKQTWSLDLIRLMNTDQQIRLLNKLYQANPEFNFLQTSGAKSIIPDRNTGPQHNFNVDLYLTMLQRDDQRVQESARDAIDRFRKKASAAREQSDRAALARTAVSYAIATGDLVVYGETVVWQQRFVRDPLTVKAVFGRNAVLTDEGIELLSGIGTPDTLSSASQASIPLLLEELSRGIKEADAILRIFQESYLLAKREPSFQEYDWTHVKELFTAVFNSRVSRSETLQRHFAVPRSEVFQVVWKGLLAALEWLNADSIHAIQAPVQGMLQRSQPEFLAAATRSLLDIGSERRRRRKEEGRKNSAPEDETLEQMSYRALMKLATSDMPALASPLILQTILDRPDASSWHRVLLSVGFLKTLRAEEAHELLLDLAKGIGEKLEEQSYVRVGESEAPKHVPLQPAVKVTTVKYLAQLLNNAEFISNDAAVEVLIELFRAAQHRDIRLAALDSLLSLLDSLSRGTQEEMQADPAVHNIMAALKTVVPVAGSINERRPVQSTDWAKAETTGVLPELSDLDSNGLPPLMSAVVSAVNNSFRQGLKKLETEFVQQMILPVLEQSQHEHTKWINMFLAKHNATALKDDVPETPIAPCLWATVLRNYYLSVPKKHLAAFNRYAVHRIAPTPAINKFSASLRADTELRKSSEVQHWLKTFDSGRVNGWETETLLTLLDPVQDQPAERGVLLGMIFQHAKLYLEEYEKYTNVWATFVDSLSPTSETIRNEVDYDRWYNNRRSITVQIIDLIRDKRRLGKRVVLPSTAKLELWLLHTLGWYKSDEGCEAFVSRLEERLRAMLQEDETCALRWPEIVRVACEGITAVLNTDDERLRVAHHFGWLGRAGDASGGASRQLRVALDLAKLEVALELIGQCQNKKKIGDSLTRRVEEWRAYDSDAIRERVFRWQKNRS